MEAHDKVKAVLSGINVKAKEYETVSAVAKIGKKVAAMPVDFQVRHSSNLFSLHSLNISLVAQLTTPTRRFVREDVLILVVKGRVVTRRKPMYCFLFNDILLRTKARRGVLDEVMPIVSYFV